QLAFVHSMEVVAMRDSGDGVVCQIVFDRSSELSTERRRPLTRAAAGEGSSASRVQRSLPRCHPGDDCLSVPQDEVGHTFLESLQPHLDLNRYPFLVRSWHSVWTNHGLLRQVTLGADPDGPRWWIILQPTTAFVLLPGAGAVCVSNAVTAAQE